MANLIVRILTMKDWDTYKQIRLSSLLDSPDSFGSTYESEYEFTSEEWVSRLDPSDRAKYALPLVAELNGVPIGLAWGLQQPLEDRIAHVYQMWVSPNGRGQGVAKLLLNRIIEWAKESNIKAVSLGVTTVNKEAVNLYESMGFQPNGLPEELREGSLLSVQLMELALCGNAPQ